MDGMCLNCGEGVETCEIEKKKGPVVCNPGYYLNEVKIIIIQ